MAALRDAGLTRLLGLAPGPANGFTLDLIACFERFGEAIDWAMIILNPLEPWPGELALPAATKHDVKLITRVVDYGGLFGGDLTAPEVLGPRDHRGFRPKGWIENGLARVERMRPIAERHGLTPLQLACQWNLAHAPVQCVAPTLLQEAGPDARPVEDKRAELAALPTEVLLTDDEVAELRAIGDNANCMTLKGGVPDHEGPALPDRWQLDDELAELAAGGGEEPSSAFSRSSRYGATNPIMMPIASSIAGCSAGTSYLTCSLSVLPLDISATGVPMHVLIEEMLLRPSGEM
jgi:hypothetical protein